MKTEMRRFILNRVKDISGVSGLGYVAEGTQFSDGTCVIRWLTEFDSLCIYKDMPTMMAVHGHNGATKLEYID